MNPLRFLDQYVLASRELDLFIAHNVMDGCIDHSPDDFSNKSEKWFWIHPRSGVLIGEPYQVPNVGLETDGYFLHQWYEFCPSTKYDHAFLIVDRLKSLDWIVHITSSETSNTVEFRKPSYGKTTGEITGETIQVAICRASYIAMYWENNQ